MDDLVEYDVTQASLLEKYDIINNLGSMITVISIEDSGDLIEITGIDLEWEEEVTFSVDPNVSIPLYRYED